MKQPTQPFFHQPYARVFFPLLILLALILGSMAWNGFSTRSEVETALAEKLQFPAPYPSDQDLFHAQLNGSSLEVSFAGEDAQRPVIMRLYDRQGQLIYTEKNPQLGDGNDWKADVSRYVQSDSAAYQLKLELENGAELLTWVNP